MGLINLFIFQISDSPSSSDLNILGEYLLVSLGFVVAAMAEFALVILLNRRSKLKTDATDLKNSHEEKNSEITHVSRFCPDTEMKKPMKQGKISEWNMPSIYVVDFIAFWLHFSAFLLYNVVYWAKHHN